jgi:hypothetical protein
MSRGDLAQAREREEVRPLKPRPISFQAVLRPQQMLPAETAVLAEMAETALIKPTGTLVLAARALSGPMHPLQPPLRRVPALPPPRQPREAVVEGLAVPVVVRGPEVLERLAWGMLARMVAPLMHPPSRRINQAIASM